MDIEDLLYTALTMLADVNADDLFSTALAVSGVVALLVVIRHMEKHTETRSIQSGWRWRKGKHE